LADFDNENQRLKERLEMLKKFEYEKDKYKEQLAKKTAEAD